MSVGNCADRGTTFCGNSAHDMSKFDDAHAEVVPFQLEACGPISRKS